jgi:hypothetical protein
MPFVGHKSQFVRRTAWAGVATLLVVALNVAVFKSPQWAGWYLLAGGWALVFFALTPLILKEMLFDRRAGRALGLIGLKLAWVGLMAGICWIGASRPGASTAIFGTALIAGVTTPLAVVVLGALGMAMGDKS